MEVIGRLAGGVAHDFNNLLSIIASATGLLADEVAPESMSARLTTEVQKACKRATELTRQLLVFSGRQILQPHTVELAPFFQALRPRLESIVGASISLAISLPPAPTTAVGEDAQLEQVLVHLVENARDAMPAGGALSLEVADVTVTAEDSLSAGLPPGEWASLAVRDTGEGMDAGVQAHLFEPFFTTKPRGKGTGLGLATVWGLVRQFRGHLRVDSAPGEGTTVTVLLPREEGPATRGSPAPTPADPNGRVILLVEDDSAVRWVAAAVLIRAGYVVHQAENGTQALALARAPGLKVDLLLTDVVMPGMGGAEVARAVKEFQPGTRVVYMSGYTSNATLRASIRDATVDFSPSPSAPTPSPTAWRRRWGQRPEHRPLVDVEHRVAGFDEAVQRRRRVVCQRRGELHADAGHQVWVPLVALPQRPHQALGGHRGAGGQGELHVDLGAPSQQVVGGRRRPHPRRRWAEAHEDVAVGRRRVSAVSNCTLRAARRLAHRLGLRGGELRGPGRGGARSGLEGAHRLERVLGRGDRCLVAGPLRHGPLLGAAHVELPASPWPRRALPRRGARPKVLFDVCSRCLRSAAAVRRASRAARRASRARSSAASASLTGAWAGPWASTPGGATRCAPAASPRSPREVGTAIFARVEASSPSRAISSAPTDCSSCSSSVIAMVMVFSHSGAFCTPRAPANPRPHGRGSGWKSHHRVASPHAGLGAEAAVSRLRRGARPLLPEARMEGAMTALPQASHLTTSSHSRADRPGPRRTSSEELRAQFACRCRRPPRRRRWRKWPPRSTRPWPLRGP